MVRQRLPHAGPGDQRWHEAGIDDVSFGGFKIVDFLGYKAPRGVPADPEELRPNAEKSDAIDLDVAADAVESADHIPALVGSVKVIYRSLDFRRHNEAVGIRIDRGGHGDGGRTTPIS